MNDNSLFAIENISEKEIEHTLEGYMFGIECALEDIDTAYRIKWILDDNKTDNISKESLVLADSIIKGLCKSYKLDLPQNNVSTENLSLTDQKTLVLEGIGSFLKNIWEGICNTFISIWKWIRSFFFGNKAQSEKQNKNIKNIKEQVEETAKKCKDNHVNVPSNEYIEDEVILRNFKYLNSNITLKDFADNLKELEKTADVLKKFLVAVFHTYDYFNSQYVTLMSILPEQSTDSANAIVGVSKALEEDTDTDLHKFINSLEKMKDRQIVDLAEKVKENEDSLKINTAKSIDGFINAGYIGFYKTSKSERLFHKCKIVRNHNDERTSKITYIDINHMSAFADSVEKLSEVNIKLNEAMAAESMKIQNADEKIKATISKLVEMCKDMDKDAVDAATKNIKDASTNMKNMIQNIVSMPTIFRETVDGYIRLLKFNEQYYAKLSKE